MLRCRHHHSFCAAATALLPLRCAPLLCFVVPPPPLTLLPLPRRRQAAANIAHALVDRYISVDSDAFLSSHPTPFLSIHPQITSYCVCHTFHNKTLCGVVRSAHEPHGLRPNQVHASLPMVCGWRLCTWLGCPNATCNGMGQSRSTSWLQWHHQKNLCKTGSEPGMILRRIM